jgi:hypothetical protein
MVAGAAGLPLPATILGRPILSNDYRQRTEVFAARDRCDEPSKKSGASAPTSFSTPPPPTATRQQSLMKNAPGITSDLGGTGPPSKEHLCPPCGIMGLQEGGEDAVAYFKSSATAAASGVFGKSEVSSWE